MLTKRMALNLVFAALLAAVALELPHEAAATDWCSGGVCQEWVARYDGPASAGSDHAYALAVDAVGNVYVTGGSEGSGTGGDYATIKYGPDGAELWVARYDGPASGGDGASALAVDGSGSVYVAGTSEGDYATIKYGPDGTELWAARYDGPAIGTVRDRIVSLAADGSANTYVTGYSGGSGTRDDYVTVKYDSNGSELWMARYDGPASKYDYPWAMAVDTSGNVYVTGYSESDVTYSDYATIKYGPDGSEMWVARYRGPGLGYHYAKALAVDDWGNVYVTGVSYGGYAANSDYATIKYDTYGNEEWVARYSGPASGPTSGSDSGYAMAVDTSGNVYVTGYSEGSTTDYDYATIKYDSDGHELWVARYDGPASGKDRPNMLEVDGSGNVYVTGRSPGSGTDDDYATVRYGPDGSELWVARYDGPESGGGDGAGVLALDGSGNVYVTGYSYSPSTGDDYATIKYSQLPATPMPTPTRTPTPTMTPHPTPAGVGGAVKIPPGAIAAEAGTPGKGSAGTASGVALAGAAAGGILLLAASGWYARRRYGRQRR